jgi:hypothetical protein
MKRSDDVFFFVLIDFLLQAFFFGLLLYVAAQAVQSSADNELDSLKERIKEEDQQVKSLGFSKLTELLDYLTKMVPANELKGLAEFFSKAGGYDKVKASVEAVKNAGGADKVAASVALVKESGGPEKVREGVELLRKAGLGKPSCNNENGRAKAVATVVASDSTIRFESETPELSQALALLGVNFEDVKELTLSQFRRTFAPLESKQPDCRYTLRFVETTRYVDARDAARFAFYLNITKR